MGLPETPIAADETSVGDHKHFVIFTQKLFLDSYN